MKRMPTPLPLCPILVDKIRESILRERLRLAAVPNKRLQGSSKAIETVFQLGMTKT